MSGPTSMVWGRVPDSVQISMFSYKLAQTLAGMKPPMPPAYRTDLHREIMAMVDGWEWWQQRWYFQYDEWEQR